MSLPNWREDATVRQLQAQVASLEGRLTEAVGHVRAATAEATSAEQAAKQAEAALTWGRGSPIAAAEAAGSAEGARSRASEARRAAAEVQSKLEAARAELSEATRRAKSQVLPKHRKTFEKLTEEYGAALRALVTAEMALRRHHEELHRQFPEGGSRPAGLGLPVFLRHWGFDAEGLAYWQRWKAECFQEPSAPKPPTRTERPPPEPDFEDLAYSGQAVSRVRLTR